MASEQSVVPGAPRLSANPSESESTPTTETISHPTSDATRTKSLKRSRAEQSQNSTTLFPIADSGRGFSPSPKSPRFKGTFTSGISSVELTGAAALADEQREREQIQRDQQGAMSGNPSHQALTSLVAGGGAGMSKPQDAPVATTSMSEGMSAVANAISIPSPMQSDDRSEISPASIATLGSIGSTAQTAIAGSTTVASPQSLTNAIEAENRENRMGNETQIHAQGDEPPSNRALTFPGNVLGQPDPSRAPPRGLSLPMPGQQLAPRSPSQKKHKCPYCETEFTRHHNLKSHLLTHSQEKPYVCQTCNMRFRRLHDLKRHTKLHTGERPHICPKCDRKFARGDALARHSKGQGGCAGRRASMGSFGGDDDLEGSAGDGDEGAMDGVMYTNGTSHPNEAEMTEEERRRFSLPSIKTQHVSGHQGGADNFAQHSRTYPPSGPRHGQPTGGLYPPVADRGGTSSTGTSPSMQNSGSGHTPNTSISSLPLNTAGSSMYSQSGMTESPKPLSPSGMHAYQLGHDPSSINRQRSPSLTTQFQQQHFGRRQSGRSSPPGMSLPSPHTSHGPTLPALAGLAPPDQRYTLSSQASSQQNPTNGSQGGQQAQQTSGSPPPNTTYHQPSQGSSAGRTLASGPANNQGSANNDNSTNLFAGGERVVLAYVQTLEDKVKQLSDKIQVMENTEKSQEDKINRLSEETFSLRNQLHAQNQPQHQPASGHS
ncbi:putative zinc finger protein 771 [Venustampulla echinocandica]|uniref:Putative zinc finger protein 771 n=1 Tax=Venustampulla echinocandica TaxID=2656787 RepID=A0A370TH90_9HELO|nr:putative zinc finger protein 771 [Venustampulla echinocandica]RDL34565.1 putative zinc finger protein 771 [Venustampulla echinocandica]